MMTYKCNNYYDRVVLHLSINVIITMIELFYT